MFDRVIIIMMLEYCSLRPVVLHFAYDCVDYYKIAYQIWSLVYGNVTQLTMLVYGAVKTGLWYRW